MTRRRSTGPSRSASASAPRSACTRSTCFARCRFISRSEDRRLVQDVYDTCHIAHRWHCQTFYEGRFYLCSRPIFTNSYLDKVGVQGTGFPPTGRHTDPRAGLRRTGCWRCCSGVSRWRRAATAWVPSAGGKLGASFRLASARRRAAGRTRCRADRPPASAVRQDLAASLAAPAADAGPAQRGGAGAALSQPQPIDGETCHGAGVTSSSSTSVAPTSAAPSTTRPPAPWSARCGAPTCNYPHPAGERCALPCFGRRWTRRPRSAMTSPMVPHPRPWSWAGRDR